MEAEDAEEDEEDEEVGGQPIFSDDEDEECSNGQEKYGQQQQQHGRVIIHLDLNAYYYQCEALVDPSLRGKPVGVQQVRFIVL
jgi:hypothetical protein